jgi:DNA repair exonuclease SbcCD ATPase subunit
MKIDKEIESVNKELDSLREVSLKLKSVQEKIVQLRGEVDSNKKYTTKLQKEIKELSEKTSDSESTKSATDLKDNKIQLDELIKTKSEYKEDALLLGCVGNLLKDTGIKSKIIRHYLPIINKLINKYLADMGFFAQFHLDENFNETIKSRHRDSFSYMSFSEGEKMRIDLALLLAWREIARLKNSANTNLLILDEVFDSSLDVVGTDEFLKLMQVLSGNTNIFVISHKSDQLIDKFENQITFVKKGNFSKLQ